MLDERRTAMDALAQSFTSRADEIDERMRGFAQSIADTVNETEQRLLDARESMEDAAGVDDLQRRRDARADVGLDQPAP